MKFRKTSFCIRGMTALALSSALALAGCSSPPNEEAHADGQGVPIGASAEEYQAALAEMEPVTLTVQSAASSPEHVTAWRDLTFKKNVESLSDGKITIDLQYNQAIVPYNEVSSALMDGRLDIAYMLPVYDPSNYPVTSALVAASTLGSVSPVTQELTVNAALTDVAWNTPELIEELETQGLEVLEPLSVNGPVFTVCSEEANQPTDWLGRQMRVSSSVQSDQMTAFSATPVSLDHTETYQALERNTIDCTVSSLMPAADQGLFEVAPHVSYAQQSSFARGPGALVAGQGYKDLPLPARQLIFDQMGQYFVDSRRSDIQGIADASEAISQHNGTFTPLDSETESNVKQASIEIIREAMDGGIVSSDFQTRVEEAIDKWQGIVEELDYNDEGDFADINHWYSDGSIDFQPLTERLDQEVRQEHRPE